MSAFSFSIPDINALSDDMGFCELYSLRDEPNPTVYHTNRSVALSLSGEREEAIMELQKSVEANPLNYIAYFNIFSIQTTGGDLLEGLKNLCCALSCLHLLKGKHTRSQSEINKAIKYSENNLQARLLKGMHYFTKGKLALALNEINWVLEIQPKEQIFLEIRHQILKKLGKTQKVKQQDNDSSLIADIVPKRLLCSLYEEDQILGLDLTQQIKQKLSVFNELFGELNSEHLTLVNKTPQVYLLGKPKIQQISFGDLGKGDRQQFASSLVIEEKKQDYGNSINNQNKNKSRGPPRSSDMSQCVSQTPELLLGEQPSSQSLAIVANDSQSLSRTNSGMPDTNSSYTLQALEDDKNLSIKVHKIQLTGMSQEETSRLDSLYCVFEYGDKVLDPSTESHYNEFSADLDDNPQILVIKVFNKEIHVFKDKLIGEGSKEIVATGRLEVPIFNKGEQRAVVAIDIRYK